MGYKTLRLPDDGEEFPGGLILINGKNSYGKSSIIQGILFAFFGPGIFTGRNASSFITYGSDKKAEIYVYFTLDNKKYYLFRKWGRTGSSRTKLFEENNKKIYMEIKKFNISEFFEISKDQALSTVFVRQGEVEELANLKGAKLRDMIIEIFRLDIIDDSLKYLENQIKEINFEKSKLEASRVPIERIEEDIKRLNHQNENNKAFIKEKKKIEKTHVAKLKTLPSIKLISYLENLYTQENLAQSQYKSYKRDFEEKIIKNKLTLKDFASLEKIFNKINALDNSLSKSKANKLELDQKKQVTTKGLGKTKGRVEDIRNKIEKMKNSFSFTSKDAKNKTTKCPTCHGELSKDHYEKVIQEFNNELKVKINKIQSILKLIRKVTNEIIILQNELDKKNKEKTLILSLKEDYENYHKYELEVKNVEEELKKFLKENIEKFEDSSPEGIKNLSSEIERMTAELNAIKNEITDRQEILESNETRITELHEEIKKMKKLEKKIGEFEIDVEHLNKAKEFVRRFVTEYMVVKRLVKNITLKTDNYIKDFTSGQYSDLLLDLIGTKKTGLSLKIKDNFNGQYEPIDVLSGGDRTALGMALRLAISELMSNIRPTKDSPKKNPKIDILLLDEPLAALDEVRRERILMHLTKSKSFSQIFLITHTEIPPDIHACQILVNKDHANGYSTATFHGQISVL